MLERTHAEQVAAWLDARLRGATPEQRVLAFQQAFDALWERAAATLGEVTLTAIAERVLQDARDGHPMMASVRVRAHGIECEQLRSHAASLDGDDLLNAARQVLVEYLTVLGNLTAEILTPGLHAELGRMTHSPDGGTPGASAAPGASVAPSGSDDDDDGAAP